MLTDDRYDPTLTLIYLPHLDYCLQKFGPDAGEISNEIRSVDLVVKELVEFYERKKAEVILLSEYGIMPVSKPIHLNRLFREHGFLQIRVEREGLELLDLGALKAFVVADTRLRMSTSMIRLSPVKSGVCWSRFNHCTDTRQEGTGGASYGS